MPILFKNKALREELKTFLREDKSIVEELATEKPEISTETLLGLKDRMFISDTDWTYLARLFKLKNGSIYKIKKLRKTLNAKAGVTTTSDDGAQRSIVTILTEILKKDLPKSDAPVKMKFAFDGCRMTKVSSLIVILQSNNISIMLEY